MMDTVTRPILRYHGGKFRLAPWILSHFPSHKVYVEPYGGAASVLLRKQRVQTEVYNDLDGHVVNVFRVLQDASTAKALCRLLALTPFARAEFELSYEPADDPVEQARRYIVRSFFGFGSKSCLSKTRNAFRAFRPGENSPAVDWSRYPDLIKNFTERLRGVVIEQRPALQVIAAYDRPGSLLYVDPPYVASTRTLHLGQYRFEMSDADHEELACALKSCKGMVIVSGYDSDLYRSLYAGWSRIARKSRADMASERTEYLWISPNTALQGNLLEAI
ncbi:MAG: DNA adenine methylase [Halodesulfovibrio sp.]